MVTGIISAMREEIQELLDNLQNTTVTIKGMRKYYQGTLFNTPVVLVFSRWGKVASSITATQLINDFNIKEIIFTGVAGAIDNELNIGDIVLGKNLYQHDMDASPLFNKFEIPLLGKPYFETKRNEKLERSTETFLKNYHINIPYKDAHHFNISAPKHKIGDILSGDEFISSKERIAYLKSHIPTATCVEMEGASVAQVCFEYNIPFSIIRIISDKANDNAHIDFPKFANDIASKYAKGILENYFN